MAFDNQELFDTHKRKFCVGSTVDPVSISSRLSVKQGNRNLHIAGDSPQTVSQISWEDYQMLITAWIYLLISIQIIRQLQFDMF